MQVAREIIGEETFCTYEDQAIKNRYTSSGPDSSEQVWTCPLCYEDLPAEDIITLFCGHHFCKFDLNAYMESLINSR